MVFGVANIFGVGAWRGMSWGPIGTPNECVLITGGWFGTSPDGWLNDCIGRVSRFDGGVTWFNSELFELSCIWNVVVGDCVVALLTPVAEPVLVFPAPPPLLAGAPGVCACTVDASKHPKLTPSATNGTLILKFFMFTTSL
jgi:hypothetical protein